MNDGVIIEDGHGSRKSFIAEFHRATSVGETNDGYVLNAIRSRPIGERDVRAALDGARSGAAPLATTEFGNDEMTGLFQGVAEATEEAIYNSLFTATTVSARGGTVEAIPVAEVVRIVDGHGMVRR